MFVESPTKVDPTAPAALAACGTPGTISAARRGTAPRTRPPAVCCSCSRCWRRAAPPPRTPPSARGKRKGGEHVLEQCRQLSHRTALLRQGASTATVPKPFALKMFGHTCKFGSFDGWSLFRHAEFRPGWVPTLPCGAGCCHSTAAIQTSPPGCTWPASSAATPADGTRRQADSNACVQS